MKKLTLKILPLLIITFISSCYHDQKQFVRLDFNFDEKESVFLEKKYNFDLIVIDERKEKDIIGKKFLGEEEIKIIGETSLSDIIKNKITQGLANKGFNIGDGKIVELHIQQLKYSAKRKFFIGDSEAKAEISVIVKNPKNKSQFSKDFKLSTENKHFIVPLKSTDDATINYIIKEILNDIISDEELLREIRN